MKALIVVEPFADYAKGDQIIDTSKIEEAIKQNPASVVTINLPDTPAPPAKGDDSNS